MSLKTCGAFALAASVLLSGCKNPSADENSSATLRIYATRADSSFGPGEVVDLSVHNIGTTTLAMGLCPQAIQRKSGDGDWKKLASFSADCDLPLAVVAAGATVENARVFLPHAIEAGTYRAVFNSITELEDMELIGTRYSEPFRVIVRR